MKGRFVTTWHDETHRVPNPTKTRRHERPPEHDAAVMQCRQSRPRRSHQPPLRANPLQLQTNLLLIGARNPAPGLQFEEYDLGAIIDTLKHNNVREPGANTALLLNHPGNHRSRLIFNTRPK